MRKFTTAPWFFDRMEGEYVVHDDNHGLIARVYEYPVTFIECNANGQLIAAAPALYEIVKRCVAHFDGTDSPLGIDARAALQLAEKAGAS